MDPFTYLGAWLGTSHELLQAGLNDAALPCASLEHGRVIDVSLMLRPPLDFPLQHTHECSTGGGDQVTWRTEACIALDETQGVSVEQLRPSDVGVLLAVLIVRAGRLSSATLLRELPILACVEIISLLSNLLCAELLGTDAPHHQLQDLVHLLQYLWGGSRLHQAAACGCTWRCRWT
jgi:hypothetical protein